MNEINQLMISIDDLNNVISYLSLIIALWALVYARRSSVSAATQAEAANHQNSLAKLESRIEVYKNINTLWLNYKNKKPREFTDETELFPLRSQKNISEFYFSNEITNDMELVFTDAVDISTINSELRSMSPLHNETQWSAKTLLLNNKYENMCLGLNKVIVKMRKEMKGLT